MRPRNCISNVSILFFSLSLLHAIGALPNVVNQLSNSGNSSRQLKLVHVVFAHKLFAPLKTGVTPGFPEQLDYQYFLENTSEMPNESKLELFNLGVLLRQSYDQFLGKTYYPEVLKMRTSEYFLSMVSGQLVNAGLWPPVESQKWKDDLDWQPIPTEYDQKEEDTLLLGTLCPWFKAKQKMMLEDESIKARISVHQPLFSSVTKNYGKKISHPSEIALLYSCLETMATVPNATLPTWAKDIFPHGEMLNVTLLSYDLLSESRPQKHLNGGTILKKIFEDSREIRDKHSNPAKNNSEDLKISLYSGEERNLIGVLQALNLWSTPHIPENGAAIIFELRYDSTDDVYGFEILYHAGPETNETIALKLPGCEAFCPLNDFGHILDTAFYLTAEAQLFCHVVPGAEEETTRSSAHNRHRQPLFLNHLFFPFVALLLSKF